MAHKKKIPASKKEATNNGDQRDFVKLLMMFELNLICDLVKDEAERLGMPEDGGPGEA